MAEDLDGIYTQLSPKLAFIPNFQHYVQACQPSTFLLLHLWFHALIALLHRPTILAEGRMPQLSMSSAKTIADIFQFSEAMGLNIKAAGNPFISQPIYIAACAFLQESASRASRDPTLQQRYPPCQMPSVYGLSLESPTSRRRCCFRFRRELPRRRPPPSRRSHRRWCWCWRRR